jgi:hypothetical protein
MYQTNVKIILEVNWASSVNKAEIIMKMILHCNANIYFNNQCLDQKEVQITLK